MRVRAAASRQPRTHTPIESTSRSGAAGRIDRRRAGGHPGGGPLQRPVDHEGDEQRAAGGGGECGEAGPRPTRRRPRRRRSPRPPARSSPARGGPARPPPATRARRARRPRTRGERARGDGRPVRGQRHQGDRVDGQQPREHQDQREVGPPLRGEEHHLGRHDHEAARPHEAREGRRPARPHRACSSARSSSARAQGRRAPPAWPAPLPPAGGKQARGRSEQAVRAAVHALLRTGARRLAGVAAAAGPLPRSGRRPRSAGRDGAAGDRAGGRSPTRCRAAPGRPAASGSGTASRPSGRPPPELVAVAPLGLHRRPGLAARPPSVGEVVTSPHRLYLYQVCSFSPPMSSLPPQS